MSTKFFPFCQSTNQHFFYFKVHIVWWDFRLGFLSRYVFWSLEVPRKHFNFKFCRYIKIGNWLPGDADTGESVGFQQWGKYCNIHSGSHDLRVVSHRCWHWGVNWLSTVGKVLHTWGVVTCGWLHSDADTGDSVGSQQWGKYCNIHVGSHDLRVVFQGCWHWGVSWLSTVGKVLHTWRD